MSSERISEEKATKLHKPERGDPEKRHEGDDAGQTSTLTGLQQLVGNRAVQRMLAQRSGEGPTALDDETASRIDQARGGGRSLDSTVQKQMGTATGHDFSGVRVHTSLEADNLNRQLGAKAFTTGRDVFFREGAYDPHSSSGQELIAHELTHVVQQGSGSVSRSSSGRMTVNAPGDAFEQEADAIAKQVAAPGTTSGEGVQRQEMPEEEELQMQPEEEEEELQMQPEEEEEELQMQPEEEEEELQMKAIQRQEKLSDKEL